jgi:hypothetical protein
LRITGTDLPFAGDNPQQRVGDPLRQKAADAGIELTYVHFEETLEELDRNRFAIQTGETLIVNAALALHHLQETERDIALCEIRNMNPDLFVLVEADSAHHQLPFMPRLLEAVRHYGTLYDVFDTLFPADMPERVIIEQSFFGREIINVLAVAEKSRYERHERLEAWIQRAQRAGFTPYDATLREPIAGIPFHPKFSIRGDYQTARLYWGDYPFVAVSAWTVA